MAKRHYAKDFSAVENAAKTLLANIRFASVDEPICSIVVTSALPDEGKTTVSANLASAIATSGKRVLLVETDMRKRSLAMRLGAHAKAGIHAVLVGRVPLAEAVLPMRPEGLFFLDAEPGIPNPSDLLATKRFSALVDQLEKAYDYVIFDTPPTGPFVDAAVLASRVDATVLVVKARSTKRDIIATAYDQLKKADANVIGTVLNCSDFEGNSYGYYKYLNQSERDVSRSVPPATPARTTSSSTHGTRGSRGNGSPYEGRRFSR